MEFTQRSFARAMRANYGMTTAQGMALFDDIGRQMQAALKEGQTVRVFGLLTLKVTQGVHGDRLRARSTAHYEREAGHGIYSAATPAAATNSNDDGNVS